MLITVSQISLITVNNNACNFINSLLKLRRIKANNYLRMLLSYSQTEKDKVVGVKTPVDKILILIIISLMNKAKVVQILSI